MSKYSLIIFTLAPSTSFALQPLDDFLSAAASRALDTREAKAQVEQRDAEAMQTWGKLLPVLSASGSYTRNQQAVSFEFPDSATSTKTVTISALNQLDATLSASVSIVDLQTWIRTAAAVESADAQRHRLQAAELETERQVVRGYYALLAAEALVRSAGKSLATQEASLALVSERAAAGLAGELDVRRAKAEVAQARQALSEAQYTLAGARRTLNTLAGIMPQPLDAKAIALEDALEPPRAAGASRDLIVPSVLAARADVSAAERTRGAAWAVLAPTLSLQANERFTNAVGFNVNPFWSVSLTARWSLDVSQWGGIRAQRAAAAIASIRAERAEQSARDQLDDARDLLDSRLAQTRAASSRLEEATLAAALAKDKQKEGKATQLDVIQSERDLFSAEVNRIRAIADLRYARALVSLSEGRSVKGRQP